MSFYLLLLCTPGILLAWTNVCVSFLNTDTHEQILNPFRHQLKLQFQFPPPMDSVDRFLMAAGCSSLFTSEVPALRVQDPPFLPS